MSRKTRGAPELDLRGKPVELAMPNGFVFLALECDGVLSD
jgi:hypothetical protein